MRNSLSFWSPCGILLFSTCCLNKFEVSREGWTKTVHSKHVAHLSVLVCTISGMTNCTEGAANCCLP